MKYWITRFSHPFRGLLYALTHDSAIQIDIALAVIGLPIVYFLFDLSPDDMLLLTFCWFFVIVTELQNSAIEMALSKIHPARDEAIGRSKDLASAAVFWAAIFGLVCLAFILIRKFA